MHEPTGGKLIPPTLAALTDCRTSIDQIRFVRQTLDTRGVSQELASVLSSRHSFRAVHSSMANKVFEPMQKPQAHVPIDASVLRVLVMVPLRCIAGGSALSSRRGNLRRSQNCQGC
jgi:hypothetical protein